MEKVRVYKSVGGIALVIMLFVQLLPFALSKNGNNQFHYSERQFDNMPYSL